MVSAFQNVSAQHLDDLDHAVDCDVLVCGDDQSARELVVGLCEDIGLRGIHAGPIRNSAAVEALTSVLIAINRRYKVPGAGIRITGIAGKDRWPKRRTFGRPNAASISRRTFTARSSRRRRHRSTSGIRPRRRRA